MFNDSFAPRDPFYSQQTPIPEPTSNSFFSTSLPLGIGVAPSQHMAPSFMTAANPNPVLSTNPLPDLRHLAISKERELNEINELRIKTLEQALQAKEHDISELLERLRKLKEDFKFNLNLIEERDAELQRYDTTVLAIQASLRQKEIELSESKIREAEADAQRKRVLDRQAEQESYWQARLKDARDEADNVRWHYEEQFRALRAELDTRQNQMSTYERDRSEEIEEARREITTTFDEMMRARDREARESRNALEKQLAEMESRLTQTSRAADQSRHSERQLSLQIDQLNSLLESRENRIRILEWELDDKVRLKDAEIDDLRIENDRLRMDIQNQKDHYQNRIDTMMGSLEQVEKAYVTTKNDAEYEVQRIQQQQENAAKHTATKYETQLKHLQDQLQLSNVALSDTKDASFAYYDGEANESGLQLHGQYEPYPDDFRNQKSLSKLYY